MLLEKMLLRAFRALVIAVAVLGRLAYLAANPAYGFFPPLDKSTLAGVWEGVIADVR
jgi:hypothetical protein